jgi:hypothetical protein
MGISFDAFDVAALLVFAVLIAAALSVVVVIGFDMLQPGR